MSNKELIDEIGKRIAEFKQIDGDTPELCVINLIENMCSDGFLETVYENWERIVSENRQEAYEIMPLLYRY